MHPQPRTQTKKRTSIVTTGSPQRSGLPCAMVLTAYSALSSATNSFCHRHLRIKGLSKPGWADAPPQTWHQQRMPGPHGFAVRISAARLRAGASLTRFSSPCNCHCRARRYRVHRIPRPTSVTIASRPSCGHETAETSGGDLPDETSEIFFARGLDTKSAQLPRRANQCGYFAVRLGCAELQAVDRP